MLNRAFAGFVVVFWAAMMAALVRVEIWPKPTILDTYPTERVLKKIFANPVPVRLNIYQDKLHSEPIGFCQIEIRPKLKGALEEELLPGQQPDTYEVMTDLKMRLSVFGMPSWFRLRGKSTFNQALELEGFDMRTKIGEGRARIVGDDLTKKVTMIFEVGDVYEERTFDFKQLQGAGFAGMFGMSGLAKFGFSGNDASSGPSIPGAGNGETHLQSETTTYFDRIEIAGSSQRVYLIYSKAGDQMWTKIWVSESDGEVLKVSTSLGLEMVSELLGVQGSR